MDRELLQTVSEHFVNSFQEAFSTMTGMSIDVFERNPESNQFEGETITGLIMLTGNINIGLIISMQKIEAATMISYMTGFEVESISENEICDGIGEIANMVSGLSKLKLAPLDYHFNVSPPFAFVGIDTYFKTKKRIDKCSVKFKNDYMEALFTVLFF